VFTRVVLGVAVVAVATFLVVLASVVKTHTCDVGCSATTFAWAQGLAVAGGLVGCGALYACWPGGDGQPEDNRRLPALAAALCACVVLYVVSLGLLLTRG
jgi:hypothetical protein